MKAETVESIIKYGKIGFAVVALFVGGAYTGHQVAMKPADVSAAKVAAACPPVVICRDVKVSCIVQKADPIKVEFIPSKVGK